MSLVRRFSLAALLAAMVGAGPSAHAQEAAVPESMSGRDPDAIAAVLAARQLVAEGKNNEAVVEANKALAKDPTFPEALVAKGDAMRAAEDYAGAAKVYSDALNFGPNSVAAYNGRGECYMEIGQTDVAMDDFRNAQERDPNNAQVLSNIGHLLVNNVRDPESAVRVLGDAIALNDQDARAYRDRGMAHAQLSEFDDAVANLQKASEVDPNDHENYQMLAAIYQLQEVYEPSIGALTTAIEVYQPKKRSDPEKFVDGYLMRADAWLKVGEKETDPAKRQAAFESAIADCDALLAIYEDRFPQSGIALFRRGRALRMLERYSDAIVSLTRAIQIAPAGQEAPYAAEALMYRGICWYYIGSNDLARGDFEQASATGGGYQDPRIFLWIGFTHHAEEDFRVAIDSYSEAIAKDSDFAIAYVNRGRAYADLREYGKAIESFNNAIRVEPSNAEHYYKSGVAYMRLEDFERAAYFLDLALHQDNAAPKMYRAMATTLRELGRDELANEFDRKAEAPAKPAGGG